MKNLIYAPFVLLSVLGFCFGMSGCAGLKQAAWAEEQFAMGLLTEVELEEALAAAYADTAATTGALVEAAVTGALTNEDGAGGWLSENWEAAVLTTILGGGATGLVTTKAVNHIRDAKYKPSA